MLKVLVLVLSTSGLAACAASDKPNFPAMSPEELAAYNSTVPLAEKVICAETQPEFSRVRRRSCMTVFERYGPNSDAVSAEVISAGGFIAP